MMANNCFAFKATSDLAFLSAYDNLYACESCTFVTLARLSPLVCIIVFLVPPDCPGPRGPPGEVLPADRQLSPAGNMPGPAAPLKSAGWLWTGAAGGGNQSVSIHRLSDSPCSSQRSPSPLPPDLSCLQVEKQSRRREETGGSVTHLQKTLIWFLRIKGMKTEKLTKPAPVVMIILHQTEVNR